MKKILLTMAFVLTALGNAWADDVTVSDVTIPEGSTATLKINLVNDGTVEYRQLFQMDLELPKTIEVLSYQLDPTRIVNVEETAASLKMNEQTSSDSDTRVYRFVCKSDDTDPIVGESGGAILTIQLLATSTLKKDDVLSGKLTGIEVTDQSSTAFRPANKTFNITIGKSLGKVILRETSTTYPSPSDGNVDVDVYRTIKANQWSTICLPFDMSDGQVKAAFGSDVELVDLDSWTYTYPGTNKKIAESIQFEFVSVSSIKKNHPYLIYVTKPITDYFEVKNVVIDPCDPDDDDDMPENFVPSTVSNKNFCSFMGTYVATETEEDDIFLADNKFWLSEGNNGLKAFRAKFSFTIVLDLSEDAGSRISMSIVDDATKIKDVRASEDDGSIYNLSGLKVERLNKKGLYIKGGKKVVIK